VPKRLGRLVEAVHFASTIAGWVAIVAMWLLLGLISAEIFARTLFKTSFLLTLEVSQWLLLCLVMMGAAWTLKAGGHVQIRLFSSYLSLRNQQRLTVVLASVGMAAFGFLAFYAGLGVVNHYIMDVRSESLIRLPLWWAWVPLCVGSVMLIIQFAGTVVENIISLRSTHERGGGLSPAWFIALGAILVAVVGFLLVSPQAPGMGVWLVLLAVLGILFAFIFGSLWIFLALMITGVLGMMIFTPYPSGQMAAKLVFNANASFVLTCLPLFIFMGELLFRSGASQHLYSGLATWVEKVPGRLLHSNILSCTVFAAISGSSAATCATIGTVAVPELKRLGYDEGISLGSLAGAGTLGLLIPPSIVLIVYGSVAAESVGQLFLGGIIPGLIIATLFMLYIGAQAIHRPSIAPVGRSYSWWERIRGAGKIIPILVVVGLVLGLIYAGVTTPTEAGAVGAVCAFATLVLYRNLSWQVIKEASWGALRTSCMIMFVIAGASLLASSIGYLRVPQQIVAAVEAAGLSKYVILVILGLIYLSLGCLFDGVSMIVLTMPIIYPVIQALGFSGIWFGVWLTILIEIAQITPPVGFNLYVLQTISGQSIERIVRNTIPFFFLLLLGAFIITLFPQIVLWLPNMMIAAR